MNQTSIARALPKHPFARAGVLLAAAMASIVLLFWALGTTLALAPEPIGSRAGLFLEGARSTLALTLSAGSLGLAIGVLAGLGRRHHNRFVSAAARFYISIFRGTPLLVQILFVYYALPGLIPGLKLGEFHAAMLALALNVGAYNAEAVRAGIQAIAKGQIEASRSLGLSSFKTMRWVVLPQALRLVIPPLVNNLAALLKDSALASSIGLLELTLAGNRISSETFQPVPVLTTVALIYLALTVILSGVAHWIEKGLRLP